MPASNNVVCGSCNVNLEGEYAEAIFELEGQSIGPFCHDCWQQIKLCSNCNKPHIWGRAIDYYEDGQYLCDTCAATSLETCEGCGRPALNIEEVSGLGKMCTRCMSELFKCTECGEWHLTDNNYMKEENGVNEHRYPTYFKKYGGAVCIKCFDSNKYRFKMVDVRKCENCNTVHSFSKVHNGVEYNKMCKNCFTELMFVCGHCDKMHDRRNTELVRGKIKGKDAYICVKCYKTHYGRCSVCSTFAPLKEKPLTEDIIGNKVCSSCLKDRKQCKQCGSYKLKAEFSSASPEVCGYCVDSSKECENCGTKDAYVRSDGSVNRCPKCAAEAGKSHIYNYSFKPFPVVHGNYNPNELLLGFENEMSVKSSHKVQRVLSEIMKEYSTDIIYPKQDGSVEHGFEIVSHPMTFEAFNSIDWSKLHPEGKIRKTGGGAGMHVHLAKNNFTTFHMYKFINFMYQNHSFIEKVSERKANSYCSKITDYKQIKRMAKEKTTGSRAFIALDKKHTMEIRCFHAPHNETMLKKNIEFLQALYEFTKDTGASKINIENFREFVGKNKKRFKNFHAFLGTIS
jgi:hypothetical protein